MKRFAHMYRLKCDMPGFKAGRKIRWDGTRERFYFYKLVERGYDKGAESIYSDYEATSFSLDQVLEGDWFEPVGELRDYIPPFPKPTELDHYVELIPDCRLVNDVDECRAINGLLADSGFQQRLYAFYRDEYNAFHGLKTEENNA